MSIEYSFVIGYGVITDKYDIEGDDFDRMYGDNLVYLSTLYGNEIFLGEIFATLRYYDLDPYVISEDHLRLMNDCKDKVKNLIDCYCTEAADPQLMCFVMAY